MARITIRLGDALYDRVLDFARAGSSTPSAYIQDVLGRFQRSDPSGDHARFDELHATAIQTIAILAKSVGRRLPDVLEEGLGEARRLLWGRGLLDAEQDRA